MYFWILVITGSSCDRFLGTNDQLHDICFNYMLNYKNEVFNTEPDVTCALKEHYSCICGSTKNYPKVRISFVLFVVSGCVIGESSARQRMLAKGKPTWVHAKGCAEHYLEHTFLDYCDKLNTFKNE